MINVTSYIQKFVLQQNVCRWAESEVWVVTGCTCQMLRSWSLTLISSINGYFSVGVGKHTVILVCADVLCISTTKTNAL